MDTSHPQPLSPARGEGRNSLGELGDTPKLPDKGCAPVNPLDREDVLGDTPNPPFPLSILLSHDLFPCIIEGKRA